MNRRILGLGLVTSAALWFAPKADALPDLVASDTPPGWSYPALPRTSNDASFFSCPLQAPALPGESATWFNACMRNIGASTASNECIAVYLNDVLRTFFGPYYLDPGVYGYFVNAGNDVIIKGGRHTLLSIADPFAAATETNENNNDWARQYIWSPLSLTLGAPVTRSGPPAPYTTGSGPYMNCEGFSGSFAAGQWWYAFAALPIDATSDVDVTLHTETPSNIPQAGFGAYTAYSALGGDHLDAVIINKNIAPIQTYYAGVNEWAGTANKVVQFEASGFELYIGNGVYGPYTMSAGDIIDLHEIWGYTAGPVSIEIQPISGSANLSASLIGPDPGGQTAFYNSVAGGWADFAPAGATEGMVVDLVSGAYHGLVVYKAASVDLAQSCTYNIVISQLPNLVSNTTPGGWSGPIVPRNGADAIPPNVTLPPTLSGNTATTSFNFSTYNAGFLSTTGPWSTNVNVDDQEYWFGYTLNQWPGHSQLFWMNTFVGGFNSIVRGGRHYVRQRADAYLEMPESNESDNDFTDWFVWTPLQLANHAPVQRFAPPYAYPLGSGPYPAGDGFRTGSTFGCYWTGVAVMPAGMSAEYDLLLHPPSAGSKDGFGDYLAYSWDPYAGSPDFCIVNYNMATFQPFDYNVINLWGYNEHFYVQQANAPYEMYLSPGVQRLGTFQLGNFDVLDLHEFYVPEAMVGVPTYISANNVGGGADLELWLFDGWIPYHTKFTAMAGVNANGSGGDEHLAPVVFDHSGYYALAVNKSKALDMGLASTYELVFSTGHSVVDAPVVEALPTEFALSSPRPNPSSSGTSVELAVPAGQGKASVVVYDLAGRRVQTLVEGEATPGRHVLRWDGRDSSGLKAAAGVYFVRLETADKKQSKKITLLR